jgi:hypothetical protein
MYSFLLCVGFVLALGSTSVYGNGGASELDRRARVVSIFNQELDLKVREKTGRNDGERVEMYLRAVNQKAGASWCAGFVVWVLKAAGINTENANAWAPSLFPKKRTTYTRGEPFVAQAADLMGIYYPNLKRIGHVGFVERVLDNCVITVEGNTNGEGSREGNGVYRKRRLKRAIYKTAKWI